MATSTLDRVTEVVADKAREQASVADSAKAESRKAVSSSSERGEARAWNAKAQID